MKAPPRSFAFPRSHYILCTMRYALEKPGGLWYNRCMLNKKANKTVNIKKPEHRKTAVKTKARVNVAEKKIKEGHAAIDTKKQSDI